VGYVFAPKLVTCRSVPTSPVEFRGGGKVDRTVTVPLDRSATWPYENAEPRRFSYARADHPTGVATEEALGELDGGRALLFPSGMAAITTVVLTTCRPGTTIALAEGAYYGTAVLFRHLERWGLRFVEYDQTGAPPDNADVIWLEAPANPMLTMPDLAAAAEHRALVVCDSTVATPLGIRPLELGCDVALHSATKYLGGHDDLLAGVATVADDELWQQLWETRRLTGSVASADTAWLLLRGLKTLDVRVARQTATAVELADKLRAHPAVSVVRYPGLGGLICFDVTDGAAALRVESAVRTIENATSLGGTRSKIESRHRWEGERCPPGLLRFSVGLENADELWADLEQALAHAGT
jgi:cystathionine gamma-synthase